MIGRHGDIVGKRDARRLEEKGHENERSKNPALQNNRNGQGAPADAPFTDALLGVSFDETPA